jgi:integrase
MAYLLLTKQPRVDDIPLQIGGASVCDLLASLDRSQFVFPYVRGKPIYNITPHWYRLNMPPDVTPHTLRHSLASLAGDLGLADSTISGLLGHARNSITSRYIHHDKSLIAAADLVAAETLRLTRA